MAGLGRPWASRDDALFWLQILAMALLAALAIVAAATLVWAVLLQPALAWWHGEGLRIVTDRTAWMHWLRIAAVTASILGATCFAFLAWYCDAMLRGSGKAEH